MILFKQREISVFAWEMSKERISVNKNMLKHLTKFFKSFISMGNSTNSWEQWNKLESEDEVDQLLEKSHQKPQLIFKHSPRCSVSKLVEDRIAKLKQDLKSEGLKADLHTVDVINASSLSQYISQQVEVRHESPQVLILKDAKVEWNNSHMMIKKEKIMNSLRA